MKSLRIEGTGEFLLWRRDKARFGLEVCVNSDLSDLTWDAGETIPDFDLKAIRSSFESFGSWGRESLNSSPVASNFKNLLTTLFPIFFASVLFLFSILFIQF